MTDEEVAAPWHEAPLARSHKKHPDIADGVKERLGSALGSISDSKPLGKSEIARLASELLNAQANKTSAAG